MIPGSWLCSLTSESVWFTSWSRKLTLVPFIPRIVNEEVIEARGGVTYIKSCPLALRTRAVVMCRRGAGSGLIPVRTTLPLSWPALLGRTLAQWFQAARFKYQLYHS